MKATPPVAVISHVGRHFAQSALFVGISAFAGLFLFTGSAFATPQTLSAMMSGGRETPPNSSTATGSCSASVDSATQQVTFSGTFTGLAMQASAASLRGLAGPGVVGPVILPQTSMTAGLSGTFQGGGVVTSQQVAGLLGGQAYCEINDATFPAGEIRGQMVPPSPTPATSPWAGAWMAVALAFWGVALGRVRSRFFR